MQMSLRPLSSARSASSTPRRSPKVWPKTSRPQPRSRTTSDCMPRRWCSDGRFSERLVSGGGVPPRRRAPATRGSGLTDSDPVGLQPELQQAQLPELVALERGQLPVRVGQLPLDVLRAEEPPLARGPAADSV